MRRARALAAVFGSAVLLAGTDAAAQATAKPQPRPPAPARRPPPPKPAATAARPAPQPPAPEDFVVNTEYRAADGTATNSVLYANGTFQRVEYGNELVIITPCDGGPTTQIDQKRKRYLVASPKDDSSTPAAKRGGPITYTTSVADTGERKELFGRQARHVRITAVREPGAGACDSKRERVETDGWFIDLPPRLVCAPARRPSAVTTGECRDEIVYTGDEATSAGYPLAYTLTTTGDDGAVSTMAMTVTAFEQQTIAADLFAAPAGYTEVGTLTALTSDSPDAVARVGVLAVTAKDDDALTPEAARTFTEALVISLEEAGVRAEAIDADTPAAAMAQARAQSLDYVLVSQVTDLRKPSRGMLGRVTGSRDFGANVEYLLTAPGSATPRASGNGRSGSSRLQSAVATARTVSRFITPFGLLSSQFDFTKAMSAAGGAGSPASAGSPDPVVNTMFSLIDSFPATRAPAEQPQSETEAIAAALLHEVSAVAEALLEKR